MRALALLVMLIAASCGSGIAPPDLTVPLRANEFGEFTLLVYDSTGLVTDGRSLEPRLAPDVVGVIAWPERQELEIWWFASACSHRPTLHVTGNRAMLRLTLRFPPEPQLPLVACPAIGIRHGFILALAEPVAHGDVILDVDE